MTGMWRLQRKKGKRHMCHPSVLTYLAEMLSPAEVTRKYVLEVGSFDINGSPRSVILPLQPAAYLGVDMVPGPGVDRVVRAEDLATWADGTCFDIVVSVEMLEHVARWQACLRGLLEVVVDGGLLLVTTRSEGFPYHPFPTDNWRYSVTVMRELLERAGFEILDLRSDPQYPGVFALARRPVGWAWPDGRTPEKLWEGVEVTPV
jgi:hypothetical protein